MEEVTFEYVHPELKYIPMTNEYAANYWHKQGWKACRLAFLLNKQAEESGEFRV